MEENGLLQPMRFYDTTAKKLQEENIKEYFDNLVEKSQVDVELNRKNVKAYNKQVKIVEHISGKIRKFKTIKGFMIFFSIVGFLCALIGLIDVISAHNLSNLTNVLLIVLGLILGISMIVIIVSVVNKKLKHYINSYNEEKKKEEDLLNICKAQISPLINLFTERDTFNIIEKTLPQIKFNDSYDSDLAQDFQENYNFIDLMNENRSVVDTVSGRLYKNPFVFYRYRNHYMGSKTYNGELVIHWTTVESDGDGGTRTVHHTQTLFASVVKPFPYYNYGTGLNYGCQSGPDLNFSRDYKHAEDYSEGKLERKIRRGSRKLERKAEKATKNGGTFTEMGNSKFDVLFGATDRDHEVQFRMLFSPLAQTNMIDLMLSQTGYGDDFMFTKRGKFNFIESEHAQSWHMDTSPHNYVSHDIDEVKRKFIEFNNTYFKNIYFDFAPLMAIPSYQTEPSMTFEPIKRDMGNYNYYEHEALANAIGVSNFQHPSSATEVLLKARCINSVNNTDCVEVKAESYSATNRVDFVPVLGGDGELHPVPVPWIEYDPVERVTNIAVKKLGLNRREFVEKTEKSQLDDNVFDMPCAYMHGLFATLLGDKDTQTIDSILDKIK